MAPKRKSEAALMKTAQYTDSYGNKANHRSEIASPSKRIKSDTNGAANGEEAPKFDHTRLEETYGIVQRDFYPAEMSNERCAMYNNNELPRPIEVLEKAIAETAAERVRIKGGKAVLHWFKRDLRINDNRGLAMAAKKAKELQVPLITLYIISPQDLQAHFTSSIRVDFDLRTVAVMKNDFEELDIPLLVETVAQRKDVPKYILDLCKKYEIKHVYCNIEYEVDELRREAKLTRECLKNGISFTAVHDDVVVPPGRLRTGGGKQYAVYSPWFRAWIAHVHAHPELLEASPPPDKNPPSARKLFKDIFDSPIPPAPPNKKMFDEDQDKFKKLWPAGEHEAMLRLQRFLNEKIGKYKDSRNFPAAEATAVVSVHHSAGTLAARTSVRMARDVNSTKNLDGGNLGIAGWISEVAWRDFYKHVLAHWPYVCMFKPFKYEYTNVQWEYDDEAFERWSKGKTGFPIVDAAMRQMNSMAYMHNRCRMIVASFLAKDLLLDWRMGERYFMEHLIDGDFASNNGGWGFSASVGVDPQPYFRIFNPLLQSEKFDEKGEYIRKWVPELRQIKGKAIHDPYGRGEGKLAEKNGYPRPMVDHKESRARALARYKAGIGRETA